MYLERITENNIGFAVSIQEELFPGESARANFEESLVDSSGYEYFLIYVGDDCAGVIGLYCIPDDPDSAWLGWSHSTIRKNGETHRFCHIATAGCGISKAG